MKVAVVAPFWKRDLLVLLFADHMAHHRKAASMWSIDLELVLVGSEYTASAAFAPEWALYVEAANSPLGAKFNAGFRGAQLLGVDYVVVMGSDSFMRPGFWGLVDRCASEGIVYAGFEDVFVYDVASREGGYWPGYRGRRFGEPVGTHRIMHRSVLDAMDWEPYDPTLDKNLDSSLTDRLPEGVEEVVWQAGERYMITSIKTEDSLTPLRRFKNLEPVPSEKFIELLGQFAG